MQDYFKQTCLVSAVEAQGITMLPPPPSLELRLKLVSTKTMAR